MNLNLLVGLYIVLGLLLSLLSIPLILRKVRRNWLYGIRTPSTLRSDEIWYPVNAYGGRWLFATGIIIVVAALIFTVLPGLSIENYVLFVTVILVLMMILLLVMVARFMRTLPKP